MKLPTSERTTDSSPQATPFSLFQSKSWSFSPLPYILCLLSNLFCSMQVLTLLWVFGWSLCRRHLVMPIPCLKYVRDLFSLMCMERDSWSSYAWSLFNSLDISLRCLSLSLLHLSCGSSEPFTVLHRLHYIMFLFLCTCSSHRLGCPSIASLSSKIPRQQALFEPQMTSSKKYWWEPLFLKVFPEGFHSILCKPLSEQAWWRHVGDDSNYVRIKRNLKHGIHREDLLSLQSIKEHGNKTAYKNLAQGRNKNNMRA